MASNYEHYSSIFVNAVALAYGVDKESGEPIECREPGNCARCQFKGGNCIDSMWKWLQEEHHGSDSD